MTAASDTFASFLTELARALDDHDVTGEQLAARVRLSRFHLDRIVSATAGEPPARLRRRVLLERAAWRLVTSDRTILDVAVEAGYGSHEAFTRSFARAYGSTPARWRRAPTQVWLGTPGHVHFHPPGGLRLASRQMETEMNLVTRMVEHHIWLVGELLTRAQTLTPQQLDTPIELSVEGIDSRPTLRSQLSRLVGQLDMWNHSMAMREYDWAVERDEPVQRMRERLAVAGPEFLTQVRTVCDEGRLDETFVDTLCEPARVFTYGGMIAHVLTFAAHRRTLAVGALHRFGITDLGDGDPRIWVAEPAA